jgi:hypothetical protein
VIEAQASLPWDFAHMVRPAALHGSGGGSAVACAPSSSAWGGAWGGEFAQILADRQQSDRQTARAAAGRLVASAFIQPVLSSLRERSFAAPPFEPGPMEKRFGLMLDWQIADRITEAANFPLVDAVADRLMPRTAVPVPSGSLESIDVAA